MASQVSPHQGKFMSNQKDVPKILMFTFAILFNFVLCSLQKFKFFFYNFTQSVDIDSFVQRSTYAK